MKKIHLNTDKYGFRYLEIDEAGNIVNPAAKDNKIIAQIKDDEVYADVGIYSRKKKAAFGKYGDVYAADNEGLYTYGDKLFTISKYGNIFDKNNMLIGEVIDYEDGDSDKKITSDETSSSTTASNHIGKRGVQSFSFGEILMVLALLVLPVATFILIPATFGSSAYSLYDKIGFASSIAAGWVTLIAVSIKMYKADENGDYFDILCGLAFSSILAASLVYFISLLFIEGMPNDGFTLVCWVFVSLFGGTGFCLVPAFLAALIVRYLPKY